MTTPAPGAAGSSGTPKKGYTRDAAAIGNILKNDPGGRAAVDAAAQQVLNAMPPAEREGAFLTEGYITDRYVRAVKVPKDMQAKHGTGTRAAGKVASGHA
jgi:hypothetical protein